MLDSLAPARRRLVLVLAGALGLALVAAVVAVVLTRTPDAATAVAQDDPGPVLLVPGYGASGAGLEPLADALRAEGREVVVVDPVDGGTGDLRAQAVALHEVAQETADEAGAASVDVVGHSAGGVVARLWVAEEGGDALARRVVTLGSPHHGTEVADLGAELTPDSCPEACRQLTSDSPLLAGLNSGDETPEGPVWVSVWTEGDQVVVPPTSGRLDGSVAYAVQDVCGGLAVEHGDLPSDPAVIAMVLDALGVDVPSGPPPPSVC
ncbi:alpha/beta fold hydrolase [uncultured Nocardioides sp.]|uniref:lipase family alpha/beta hydrolase n=1 Tax=uncultured Nocardioides sp. TaxID=198441 RepID=UPI0026243EE8|nr:alpha/beta fold hydrolase [uncultured Nocardioides sp.]